MPGHLRTGGYLRHVQPIALRDGITEWARTLFQEEDRVFKYPFLKRRARSTASLPGLSRGRGEMAIAVLQELDYWAVVRAYFYLSLLYMASRVRVLVFLEFVYWLFLYYTIAPGLFGGRGEMAMAVLCCHPFYGTACAVGLTWRPLTGSLFLSSFWCRLKPGPSGERGRKSGLLQDMLVTGRPTRTTGGRSSRGLTGKYPGTDRS